MAKTLVTAPTSKPITLSEAKNHLRITANDDDKLITSLIAAAVDQVEEYTWRRLITQTWDLFEERFTREMPLPYGSLQSVTTVKYYDVSGNIQTLSSSVYDVDTDNIQGNIRLVYNQTWPSIYSQPNPIEIRFICGYGAASAVPESIRQAIKIKVELLYGNLFDNEREQLMMAYKSLLEAYRVGTFC